MTTQVYLRDPMGNLQSIFSNFAKLEYARGENNTGFMELTFDPASIDTKLFRLDTRLEPWRQVGANAPYLDGETVFLVKRVVYEIDNTGREYFRVYAADANCILDGRNVAYAAGEAQSEKTALADNLMNAIVRENLGALATDTARDLTTWLGVAGPPDLGPSITKAFSRRQVSAVLQDIALESYKAGTYLVYDTVYTSPTKLEFRTYVNRRGNDHGRTSSQPVIISRERMNLENPILTEDHENEYTYIYAGGQGTGTARVVKTASAATNVLKASPFARRELWVDARNTDTEAAIQSEADTALIENRYKLTLTGRIIDTEGCMDGVHYRYGDTVYAEYQGIGFDNAHITMMHVTVEGGMETRVNQLKAAI